MTDAPPPDAPPPDAPPPDAPPPRAPGQPRNPLHGVTLERMVTELAAALGWAAMARRVPVRCFTHDPSVASSLKFLRRTPWARAEVEALYLAHRRAQQQRAARRTRPAGGA